MSAINHDFYDKGENNFDPYDYPQVEEELTLIRRETGHLPSANKAQIIISYYKDHSLKGEWVKDSPELVRMITSRHFRPRHLEALFDSSRSNSAFLGGLERHIERVFSQPIFTNINHLTHDQHGTDKKP